jgi:hypothetical protein
MRICWNCKQKICDEDLYGDIICPYCKVMCSFYDPEKFEPLPEEENK